MSVSPSNAATELPPLPHDTKFKQQTLPAFQPMLSPGYVISFLFFAVIVFIPLGVAVVIGSDRVVSTSARYDDLNDYKYGMDSSHLQQEIVNGTIHKQGLRTRFKFTVDKTIEAPAYLYYRLTNMFQNHREYRNSRSTLQLRGDDVERSDLVDCIPFRSPSDQNSGSQTLAIDGEMATYDDMTYVPCGIGAWSMFNDSFVLYKVTNSSALQIPTDPVENLNRSHVQLICNTTDFGFDNKRLMLNAEENPCTKEAIAFPADSEEKYKKRSQAKRAWARNNTEWSSSDVFHRNGWYANEVGHFLPSIDDEDFMVWMRTAPLSTFKKLLRRIDVDMEAGEYVMEVSEFFDSSSFSGEKHFVIQSNSWIGGKNYFLGISYLVAGSIAFIMAVTFFARWKVFPSSVHQDLDLDRAETAEYIALKERRAAQEGFRSPDGRSKRPSVGYLKPHGSGNFTAAGPE